MGERLKLRDDRELLIRSAQSGDGQRTYEFMYALGASTDLMLTYPGDMRTPAEYEQSIAKIASGEFYTLCAIDPETGAIAGSVAFMFGQRVKIAHTAGLAMGVLPAYQGAGLGTWLLNRGIEDMRKHPRIRRLHLMVMEGNDHARTMYERAGFVIEGYREAAVCQPDGTLRGEHLMGMWIGAETDHE